MHLWMCVCVCMDKSKWCVTINGNIRQNGQRNIPGGPKKRPELSHGVMQQSRWNESAEKHVCNEQTSSNMSMNFHLKCFYISRDTSEIVLHVIKQCLQAVRHLRCWLYAGYTERQSNSYQSADQQKMCWIGPPFCFATAAKRLFHCNIAFLTVWSSTSCHLSLITFWRSLRFANGSSLPL